MLLIRRTQMSRFGQRAVDIFRRRLAEALARDWVGETVGERELMDRVRWAIDRAGEAGIVRQRDVADLAALGVVWRQLLAMPNPSWADAVLNALCGSGADKVFQLQAHTCRQLASRLDRGDDPALLGRARALAGGLAGFDNRPLDGAALQDLDDLSSQPASLDVFGDPETCRLRDLTLRLTAADGCRSDYLVVPERDPRLSTGSAAVDDEGTVPTVVSNGAQIRVPAPVWHGGQHGLVLVELCPGPAATFCVGRAHPHVTIGLESGLDRSRHTADHAPILFPLWAAPLSRHGDDEPEAGEAPLCYRIEVAACHPGVRGGDPGSRLTCTLVTTPLVPGDEVSDTLDPLPDNEDDLRQAEGDQADLQDKMDGLERQLSEAAARLHDAEQAVGERQSAVGAAKGAVNQAVAGHLGSEQHTIGCRDQLNRAAMIQGKQAIALRLAMVRLSAARSADDANLADVEAEVSGLRREHDALAAEVQLRRAELDCAETQQGKALAAHEAAIRALGRAFVGLRQAELTLRRASHLMAKVSRKKRAIKYQLDYAQQRLRTLPDREELDQRRDEERRLEQQRRREQRQFPLCCQRELDAADGLARPPLANLEREPVRNGAS